MKVTRRDLPFFVLFGLFLASASAWLVAGLVPVVVDLVPDLHSALHRWGSADHSVGEMARNAAQTSHTARSGFQVVLDYLFSAVNFALALMLIRLRPRDLTARLLAVAMIGTAVAFNLQGHDALQVVPTESLGVVDVWHSLLHLISGLCYLFALLLFPEGRLPRSSGPLDFLRHIALALAVVVLAMMSMISVDDHTVGLVVTFGLGIPVAGLVAQAGRYRHPADAAQRERSRILLLALVLALGAGGVLTVFTNATGPVTRSRVVEYEISALRPGTYYFRCDPHPDDMKGVLNVLRPEGPGLLPREVEISARKSRFDQDELVLPAGATSKIVFTSFDVDPHNVALYETSAFTRPVFIGSEFSGHATSGVAFRVFRVLFTVIPLALFVGLIRVRMWDVNRIANRTLLYGVLVGAITIAYLAAIALVGALFGSGRRFSVFVSIVLTLLIAALFQPLRDRARRLANRLVYGERASPYEVLAEFSKSAAATHDIERVLPTMAEAVGRGVAALDVGVWLRLGDRLILTTSWPHVDRAVGTEVDVRYEMLPELEGVDHAVPVEDQGRLLGAITVTKPRGLPLTPTEERLLDDVGAQAGLVLRNAQLNEQLKRRLDELRASRERIVAAQDEERRRLERDLHDGAQQHLVALSAKLQLAQQLAAKDRAGLDGILQELQGDATDALQTLRDLARGVYPPLLADKGLLPALEAYARRCAGEVRVSGHGIGRLGTDVETALYFCALEAIQNALHHGAPPVAVTLHMSDGVVHMSVADRGPGFDVRRAREGSGLQNMTDRIAAIGGTLQVRSTPGDGTTISCEVVLG